jgi:hypothetical protein
MALERTSDFPVNGAFSSSSFNDEFDRITLVHQDLDQKIRRCLRLPMTAEATDTEAEFGPIANWLSKYVYISADGVPEPATAVTEGTTLSRSTAGAALYPVTAAETAAGVTPSDYAFPSHDAAGVIYVERYGFDKTNTTSDQSTPLQKAYDVAVQCGGGIIEIPDSDFRATMSIEHAGIVFRGQGGISSATIWRNAGATAPVTFDNADRGIVGSGLERLKLMNQNSATYLTTDGLVLTAEATGLNQMDYLSFEDIYILNFRDNLSITGRCIWGNFDRVRCESALRDGFSLTGSDNFSQNRFMLCRFGNSGRHGFYANLTFAGLLATSNAWDACTFEQNEQNGVRITGTYGLSGWAFDTCYMEENAGAIAASSSSPRKVQVHVDSVYAIALDFDRCVMYGNSAPDVDIDYGIYVDTTSMTAVSGSVDNCRITDAVVGAVYWPKNCVLGINDLSGTSVYDRTLGSVSLSDQNALATWTPGIAFGGGTTGLTYTTQVGRYQVFGRTVVATGYIVINDNGSSSGAATITGLPVTAANITNLFPVGAVSAAAMGASTEDPLTARVVPNTTTATLWQLSSGVLTALTETELANGTALAFTLTYFL